MRSIRRSKKKPILAKGDFIFGDDLEVYINGILGGDLTRQQRNLLEDTLNAIKAVTDATEGVMLSKQMDLLEDALLRIVPEDKNLPDLRVAGTHATDEKMSIEFLKSVINRMVREDYSYAGNGITNVTRYDGNGDIIKSGVVDCAGIQLMAGNAWYEKGYALGGVNSVAKYNFYDDKAKDTINGYLTDSTLKFDGMQLFQPEKDNDGKIIDVRHQATYFSYIIIDGVVYRDVVVDITGWDTKSKKNGQAVDNLEKKTEDNLQERIRIQPYDETKDKYEFWSAPGYLDYSDTNLPADEGIKSRDQVKNHFTGQ